MKKARLRANRRDKKRSIRRRRNAMRLELRMELRQCKKRFTRQRRPKSSGRRTFETCVLYKCFCAGSRGRPDVHESSLAWKYSVLHGSTCECPGRADQCMCIAMQGAHHWRSDGIGRPELRYQRCAAHRRTGIGNSLPSHAKGRCAIHTSRICTVDLDNSNSILFLFECTIEMFIHNGTSMRESTEQLQSHFDLYGFYAHLIMCTCIRSRCSLMRLFIVLCTHFVLMRCMQTEEKGLTAGRGSSLKGLQIENKSAW